MVLGSGIRKKPFPDPGSGSATLLVSDWLLAFARFWLAERLLIGWKECFRARLRACMFWLAGRACWSPVIGCLPLKRPAVGAGIPCWNARGWRWSRSAQIQPAFIKKHLKGAQAWAIRRQVFFTQSNPVWVDDLRTTPRTQKIKVGAGNSLVFIFSGFYLFILFYNIDHIFIPWAFYANILFPAWA